MSLCRLTRLRPRLPPCRRLSGDGGGRDAPPPEPLPSLLEPTHPADDRQWSDAALYPEGSRGRQSQARRSARPAVDPRHTSVLLFPGQGAQRVGMTDRLLPFPLVADMFAEASDILGYDLLELCRRGPAPRLDRTEHAQPALLVTSLAAVERLRDERPRAVDSCMAAAGFSVGELAALTFSGALSFSAAVRLAHVRGRAMQLASELAPSGMMTVLCRPDARLGFACSLARRWCEERGLEAPQCAVASFLFPQCKVVAGHVEALDFIAERAAEFGLRRCTRLRVSGAFHTPLMAPAAEPLRAALADTRISAPRVPVYSNVDGRQYRSAEHVRRRLVEQLTKPVKWEQTMHVLYERSPGVPFPDTYECGPGDTLTAILKKVNAKAADSCNSVEV
ncbi:probable malonyl-CoA-acyl carrier protein transacylase, mitochondrial [Amphibalanus amphitrite]|uniref:probable malonyl-CoA-acyl carrier protein transacylase, mitochondrial n=1 Tax=Amphibalanus amphitrite TaxID=1232801 RepID=UPI001C9299AC|nr:probable malonyl-CoA-acyl carrier protein transacylase, mitochondrial [Amphibalanus amphitrite]XP_043241303.1 probable malonyl-CoA-acyl carrier protein transacylase, mitochondrial [Amphibalanus amphitrite]